MRVTFYLIILSFVFSFNSYAQGTELSLNLKQGEEYKQIVNSKSTITQEVNGQMMEIEMVIKGETTFLVKAINSDGFEMETQYNKLSMSMKSPQGTAEFNSEKNDPNDVVSNLLGAMLGESFQVIMTKTGKVAEVNNIESLWENAIDQFDHLQGAQKEQIKAQIINAYGAKALKGNIESVTAIYPDEPVSIGDQWTVKTNLEAGMASEVTSEYEFVEMGENYALINGESTIQTADKDAYIESNGMPMKFDMSGTMSSGIKVDKETGWIVEATINQVIEGAAQIKENDRLPQGMEIPMTITSETKVTSH